MQKQSQKWSGVQYLLNNFRGITVEELKVASQYAVASSRALIMKFVLLFGSCIFDGRLDCQADDHLKLQHR